MVPMAVRQAPAKTIFFISVCLLDKIK